MRSVRATVNVAAVVVLCCFSGQVAYSEDTECANPDTAQLYTGPFHWKTVNAANVRLHDGSSAHIRLFRSVETAGCSGSGNPMYATKLIIDSGRHVLYRYDSDRDESNLWLGTPFEMRDVMGLGTPQVLFQTGHMEAPDGEAHQHIVPISGPSRYKDVGIPEMNSSLEETLGWIRSHGRSFAVKANPITSDSSDDDLPCHICPHHYRYVAYAWVPASSKWEVVMDTPAAQKIDAFVVDPLEMDREYIHHRLP